MFKPTELMKIELEKYTLFGFINLATFHVTHAKLHEGEVVVCFNSGKYPLITAERDMFIDAEVRLFVDQSLVAESNSGLVYATADINKEEQIIDTIVASQAQRVANQVVAQMLGSEQREEFEALGEEEQQTRVATIVDAMMQVSERLTKLRAENQEKAEQEAKEQAPGKAVPQAVPAMAAEAPAEEKAPAKKRKPATRRKPANKPANKTATTSKKK